MIDLSSLIKKINSFYKDASKSYLEALGQPGYSMPDDPEEEDDVGGEVGDIGLYPKIENAARQISNPDVLDEVLLIGELYKKALTIGGGFNLVNKAVSNLVNMLDDEDDDEQMAVEDLMNEISKDLRARAKFTPEGDSDQAIKALQNVKNELNARLISEDLEGDEPTAYEAGLSQYQEGAEGVFDPTGGVSQEVGKTKGRGYRIESRSYKDWVQSYENERQRYLHELEDPKIKLSRTADHMKELVNLLEQMIVLTKAANQLEAEVQAAPTPENQEKLDKIKQNIKEYQTRRSTLKKSLRNFELAKKEEQLNIERGSARTPQEQELAQEKIELINLMKSRFTNKGEESKWRRILINSMSEGRSISPQTKAALKQKIQEAAALKKSPKEQDVERGAYQAKMRKTIEKEKEDGKRNQYDFANMQLANFIEHLTVAILAKRKTFKDALLKSISKAKTTEAPIKELLDRVARAATNKRDIGPALKDLRTAIREIPSIKRELLIFLTSIAISKMFYDFRNELQEINVSLGYPADKSQRESFIPSFQDLDYTQIAAIRKAIKDGKNLLKHFEKYQGQWMTGSGIEVSFGGKSPTIATNLVKLIVEYLEHNIKQYGAIHE